MSEEHEKLAAVAIASASPDKEDQFLAKHWDKVQGEEVRKHRLLRQGRAVVNAFGPPSNVIQHPNAQLKAKGANVGDWVTTPSWFGQIVFAAPKSFTIMWYAASNKKPSHSTEYNNWVSSVELIGSNDPR